MKEWCKEHPVMTFIIILVFIQAMCGIVASITKVPVDNNLIEIEVGK